MGLFSGFKNYLTGGGAEVSVEFLEEPSRGRLFKVKINAVVGDTDCDVNKVYLIVRGTEHVQIPDVAIAEQKGETIETNKQTLHHDEVTFTEEHLIAQAMTLEAEQTYSWEAAVQIPEDGVPTFKGKNAGHAWKLMAGLDTRGNDPDSGWVEFSIV